MDVAIPHPRRIVWPLSYRIIASRYPPIEVFERTGLDKEAVQALIALEQMTNPRLRQMLGRLSLVPEEQIVTGEGAGYVMAAFTHVNPRGSRFSDGSYGAWYAADSVQSAIVEHSHHWARFAADSDDPPRSEDMRVLCARVDADLVDIGDLDEAERKRILDPSDYGASRDFARMVREQDLAGLHYASIRAPGGLCVCFFRPDCVSLPVRQERHLKYHWDGRRVDRVFDYTQERWRVL